MNLIGKIPRVLYADVDDVDTLKTRVCETRFTKSETESQKLDF